MMTPTPTPHDVWFGSAIIARALKDGLDDESARAWFTPGEEFNHVCAMTGKSPAAVQALATDIFRRGDRSIVDRLIATADKRAVDPQCVRRNTLAIDDDEDQPLGAGSAVVPLRRAKPQSAPRVRTIDRVVKIGDESCTLHEWSRRTGIPANTIYSRFTSGRTPGEILRKGKLQKRFSFSRHSKLYQLNGERLSLYQWAQRTGISHSTLYQRVKVRGHSLAHALQGVDQRPRTLYTYDGQTLSLREWSDRVGIPETTLRSRIASGMSIDKALTQKRHKGRKHAA